ncbi:DUF445 domain-containing protein [Bacillus xiapuensis]|uniref:DUF445 domain-containing protein n=1 Tax=Bacillus xiapuensis TaxID=2014075 RepID=UPI001E4DB207|nr:DUF445 family protein [Bacillus xiapuensis]
MNVLFLIIFMVTIGAVIGAVTNSIAIRMLFRPYRPIHIGKWKLPFTPGLIPKRRGELADQLGKMVAEYLLTPDSIERKLSHPDFQKEAVLFLQQEAKQLLAADKTIGELLEAVHVEEPAQKTEQWLDQWIERKYKSIKQSCMNQTVRESLPAEWTEKMEKKIPQISEYILEKGIDYFSSWDGQQRIKKMTDDFLANWGKLGSMLQMVLGNTSLEEKIQPEIIKFLRNPGTKELLDTLLADEWKKILDWKWGYIFSQFSDEKALAKGKAFMIRQLDIPSFFQRPVSELLKPFEERMIRDAIPALVDKGIPFAASRIPAVMEKLHIADIVRQQVESFSIERLEEMVLEISRRELKMITFLGGVLGGAIGLIQGIVVGLFG